MYEFTNKILFDEKSEVQAEFTGPSAAETEENLKSTLK
jgi:hypothetical protein